MHLRVSASDLDALRYFRESEEADLGDLLAQLRRELPPTPQMEAGTALHDALEHIQPGEHEVLEAKGYRFEIGPDVELALPDIREMKATRDYEIDGVTVTLVGKVDGILGRLVIDHKMTSRYDPERFLSSIQWRVYLEVFGADEFRWIVYESRERGPQDYVINAVHPLTMHRYPGMKLDLDRELHAFVGFARKHLPENFTAEAA